jgi:membrane-bound lytic murein transglycosylase F
MRIFANLLIILLLLTGCGQEQPVTEPGRTDHPVQSAASDPAAPAFISTGDLDAIREHGTLRILVHGQADTYLARRGFPHDFERRLTRAFAAAEGLSAAFTAVENFEDLVPALREGRGDLIAANMTVTDTREQLVDFTLPVDHSREQLVIRADAPPVSAIEDLSGRTLAVQAKTSFMETARRIRQQVPDLHIQTLPGHLTGEHILDMLAAGDIDFTVEDSNLLRVVGQYRNDIRPALDLTPEQAQAWAVRPDNPQLLQALNRFITDARLMYPLDAVHTDDLDGIRKRGTLRLLTRNNAATYFLWRGQLLGFEYELAQRFADQHGLHLQVIVADGHRKLIPMLLAGEGDLIAAFMTPNDARRQKGVAFSVPYHHASEVVVAPAGTAGLDAPEDLAGRYLAVRKESSYRYTLDRLQDRGIDLRILEAPDDMETEELIDRVGRKQLALTVADSHLLDIAMTIRDDVQGAFPLGPPVSHGWGVRAGNPELLAAVNDFLSEAYRGLFYNMTYNKYFKSPRRIRDFSRERPDLRPDGTISPFDARVKKYAGQYGFDWRLILSQMYQESRFDPAAVSWSGAKGLMQLMPRTAEEMGFDNLEKPDNGIHAGVKYLDRMRARFDADMDPAERTWLALASYNVGLGHVFDAQRLARQQGLNPNRWFHHVEKAMALLEQPEYAAAARHGYCRGSEPVKYVRNIRDRFRAYVQLTGDPYVSR